MYIRQTYKPISLRIAEHKNNASVIVQFFVIIVNIIIRYHGEMHLRSFLFESFTQKNLLESIIIISIWS